MTRTAFSSFALMLLLTFFCGPAFAQPAYEPLWKTQSFEDLSIGELGEAYRSEHFEDRLKVVSQLKTRLLNFPRYDPGPGRGSLIDQALPLVKTTLNDRHPFVVRESAAFLALCGPRASTLAPILRKLLVDPDPGRTSDWLASLNSLPEIQRVDPENYLPQVRSMVFEALLNMEGLAEPTLAILTGASADQRADGAGLGLMFLNGVVMATAAHLPPEFRSGIPRTSSEQIERLLDIVDEVFADSRTELGARLFLVNAIGQLYGNGKVMNSSLLTEPIFDRLYRFLDAARYDASSEVAERVHDYTSNIDQNFR